jgi:hypothetical protein
VAFPSSYSRYVGGAEDDEFDPVEDDRVSVSLEITSATLSADAITAVLGREPDRSWNIGDRRTRVADESHPKAHYEFSRWSLNSPLDRHARDDEHLSALWTKCAALSDRIAELDGNIETCLSFYRNLDGRAYQGHGFVVPAHWTEWLGKVGGVIDVDQYVLSDGPDADD